MLLAASSQTAAKSRSSCFAGRSSAASASQGPSGALHLLDLQPPELLAPPTLRSPDLADCVHHVLALRDRNIDLLQLRVDLFRLVSLPCHCSPPGCQRHTSSRTTSMGVDQAQETKHLLV